MRCVIAGSYRRFYERILHEVVTVFEKAGIEVLYPQKSRMGATIEEFGYLFFERDMDLEVPDETVTNAEQFIKRMISNGSEIKASAEELARAFILEESFIKAGINSDFVYVFNPEGYVGNTTATELGLFFARSEASKSNRPFYMPNLSRAGTPERAYFPEGLPIYAYETILDEDGRRSYFDNLAILESGGGFYKPPELVEHLKSTGKLLV